MIPEVSCFGTGMVLITTCLWSMDVLHNAGMVALYSSVAAVGGLLLVGGGFMYMRRQRRNEQSESGATFNDELLVKDDIAA